MSKKLALIIGIENYPESSGLPQVTYALNDARAIARYARKAGFHLINREPLLDENASYGKVIEQLDFLFYHANAEDFVLLYFAGHGHYDVKHGGYLIPYDYQKLTNINESDAISYDSIGKRFKEEKTRRFLLFLDTCHSGAVVKAVGLRAPVPDHAVLSPQAQDRLDRQMDDILQKNESSPDIGRVIFTSSGSGENSRSVQDFHHGLFTHYLLAGLKAENGQDTVNVEKLIPTVKDNMLRYCLENDLKQTPNTYTYVQGEFLIPAYDAEAQETPAQEKNTALKTPPARTRDEPERWNRKYGVFNRISILVYILLNLVYSFSRAKHYVIKGGAGNISGALGFVILVSVFLYAAGKWGINDIKLSKKDRRISRLLSLEFAKIFLTSSLTCAAYLNSLISPDTFFSAGVSLFLIAVVLNIKALSELINARG